MASAFVEVVAVAVPFAFSPVVAAVLAVVDQCKRFVDKRREVAAAAVAVAQDLL